MKNQIDEMSGDVDKLSVDYAEILSPDEFHDLLSSRDQLQENYAAAQRQVTALTEKLSVTVDLRQSLEADQTACVTCLHELETLAEEQDVGPLSDLPSKLIPMQDKMEEIKNRRSELTRFADSAKRYEKALKEYLVEVNVVRKLSGSAEPVEYSNYLCIEKLAADLSRKYDAVSAKAAQHASIFRDVSNAYEKFLQTQNASDECLSDLEATVNDRVLDGRRVKCMTDVTTELEYLNAVRSEVIGKKDVIDRLNEASSNLIDTLQSVSSVSPSEVESVQATCDCIKKRYDENLTKLNDYMAVMKTRQLKSEDTRKSMDHVEQSLETTCLAISDLEAGPVMSPAQLSEQIKEKSRIFEQLQDCQLGIDAIEDSLKNISDKDASDALVQEAQQRLQALREHYRRAVESYQAINSELQQAKQRLTRFSDTSKSCSSFLDTVELALANDDDTSSGDLASQRKALAKLKADITARGDDFHSLEDSFVDMLEIPNLASSYISSCEQNKTELLSRLERVNDRLTERSQVVDQQQQEADKCDGAMDAVRQRLQELEDRVNRLTPTSLSNAVLERQSEEVSSLVEIYRAIGDDKDDLEKLITSSTAGALPADTAQQLEELTKRYDNVGSAIKDADSRMQQTNCQLSEYKTSYDKVFRSMSEELDKIKSVEFCADKEATAAAVDSTKSCKEVADAFVEKINQLSKQADSLVSQSHNPSSTEASLLQSRITTLQELLSELKATISSKEQELHSAGDKLKVYTDTANELRTWLEDTEELIANQKPPSTDHKVLKAQLEEQKLVEKLIDDKYPQMEKFKDLVDEVCHVLKDDREKMRVHQELDEITSRFDALCASETNRTQLLRNICDLAEDWNEMSGPLEQWLEQAEKQLQKLEYVATSQDRLGEQIELQKELHEDIQRHKEMMDAFVDGAQRLVDVLPPEDAESISEQVDAITRRYDALGSNSLAFAQLLDEMLTGVTVFFKKTDEITDWISKMEEAIINAGPVGIYMDVLEDQTKNTMAIGEEISLYQTKVSEIVEEGRELCKHTSGDEAVALQSKIESIRIRYSDLNKSADQMLGSLEEAWPLAETFHKSSQALTDWLQAVESDLSHLDETSIENQQELIKNIEEDIVSFREIFDQLNSTGTRLRQLTSEDKAAIIEVTTARLNRRFEAVCEQAQRRAERLLIISQESTDVLGDMDDLTAWFQNVETDFDKLSCVTCDPAFNRKLLDQSVATDKNVRVQRGHAKDLIASGKRLVKQLIGDDKQSVLEKIEVLKLLSDGVSQISADRVKTCEEASSLSAFFETTCKELDEWFAVMDDEFDSALEILPSTQLDQLNKQLQHSKELQRDVADARDAIEKLMKTGVSLSALVSPEDEARIADILEQANLRFDAVKDHIRLRSKTIDEAIQQSAQFSDKLDGMLNSLSVTAEQIRKVEPIASHPDRIRTQIEDNCALMEELEHKNAAYEALKCAASDIMTKANADDPAVADIHKKMELLETLWNEILAGTESRGMSLAETLSIAECFWEELQKCMAALSDLKTRIEHAEPPSCEPDTIKAQQSELDTVGTEIYQQAPKVDMCKEVGQHLLHLVGEPEKPEIQQKIDELDLVWETVTHAFHRRSSDLIDAMEKAMAFYEILDKTLKWIGEAEIKLESSPTSCSGLVELQKQIDDLVEFKEDLDRHAVKLEQLNQQAATLTEGCSPDKCLTVQRTLLDVNKRWDNLSRGILERQHELEKSLLQMGHFEEALDQLLDWMTKTERAIDEVRPYPSDLKQTEIEIAKLKVIQNDVLSHQVNIDTLNDARTKMTTANTSKEVQGKLDSLNVRWDGLHKLLASKMDLLMNCRADAEAVTDQMHDLMTWIIETDTAISGSRSFGGIPETAKEQLDRFMVIYDEVDANKVKIEELLRTEQDEAVDGQTTSPSSLNVKNLKQRWDGLLNKVNDRKTKLELALQEAVEFDDLMIQFTEWLQKAENYLNGMTPVSHLIDPLSAQMDEHQIFQNEVELEREIAFDLDKKGTKLKYTCQKQDVTIIKNALASAKNRWNKVLARSADRSKLLEAGYKETSDFLTLWKDLCNWCEENSRWLNEQTSASSPSNAEKIKEQLEKHKEFQAQLASKQAEYDAAMRMGKSLKDHAPKMEQSAIQELLNMIRNKWTALTAMSNDRQRKLEEALLFCGQFKEAVSALLAWLDSVGPSLDEKQPLNGDLDTVIALCDEHRNFVTEFKSREANIETVHKAAKELLSTGDQESNAGVQRQVEELDAKWEHTKQLAIIREKNLNDAKILAESFHRISHSMLEWLSDVESTLKDMGSIPENEDELLKKIEQIEGIHDDLVAHSSEMDQIWAVSNQILDSCHPKGEMPMKHFTDMVQARYDEVSTWAEQREDRMKSQLQSLRELEVLLNDLLRWMGEKEQILNERLVEEIPPDIAIIEQLIEQHHAFEADLRVRQPDIDEATKGLRKADSLNTKEEASSPKTTKKPSTPQKLRMDRRKNPKVKYVSDKWRKMWLLSLERQQKLNDMLNYAQELKKLESFNFDDWRQRYLKWINHKKSRVMDFFRRQDKDCDGKVTREEFVEGILSSKFPTTRLEMNAVADLFDKNGFIDYIEFIDALRPDREPKTDAEKIKDEVQRQSQLCTCQNKYKIKEVGDGKYKFGEQLRLVRILRSTVMVRVGGGWVALDEFLVKNDPCRAKGRTNIELREKFILPEGVSQSMWRFKAKSGGRTSSDSHGPTQGPIVKIRERTERSFPMSKTLLSNSVSHSPDSEVLNILSSARWQGFHHDGEGLSTPDASRLAQVMADARSASRSSSRASSDIPKPSSRPSSRASSDVSDISLHSRDSLSSGIPTRIPSARKKPRSKP